MVASGAQPSYVDLMSSAYRTKSKSARSAADFRKHHHEYADTSYNQTSDVDRRSRVGPTTSMLSTPNQPSSRTPTRARESRFETGFVMSSTPRRRHRDPELSLLDSSRYSELSASTLPGQNKYSAYPTNLAGAPAKESSKIGMQRLKHRTAPAVSNTLLENRRADWRYTVSAAGSGRPAEAQRFVQSHKPLHDWSKNDVREKLFRPLLHRKKATGTPQVRPNWINSTHSYDYDSDDDSVDSVPMSTYRRRNQSKTTTSIIPPVSESDDEENEAMSLAQYAAKILEKHGIQAYKRNTAGVNTSTSSSEGCTDAGSIQGIGFGKHDRVGHNQAAERDILASSVRRETGQQHELADNLKSRAVGATTGSAPAGSVAQRTELNSDPSGFASRYLEFSTGNTSTGGEWWRDQRTDTHDTTAATEMTNTEHPRSESPSLPGAAAGQQYYRGVHGLPAADRSGEFSSEATGRHPDESSVASHVDGDNESDNQNVTVVLRFGAGPRQSKHPEAPDDAGTTAETVSESRVDRHGDDENNGGCGTRSTHDGLYGSCRDPALDPAVVDGIVSEGVPDSRTGSEDAAKFQSHAWDEHAAVARDTQTVLASASDEDVAGATAPHRNPCVEHHVTSATRGEPHGVLNTRPVHGNTEEALPTEAEWSPTFMAHVTANALDRAADNTKGTQQQQVEAAGDVTPTADGSTTAERAVASLQQSPHVLVQPVAAMDGVDLVGGNNTTTPVSRTSGDGSHVQQDYGEGNHVVVPLSRTTGDGSNVQQNFSGEHDAGALLHLPDDRVVRRVASGATHDEPVAVGNSRGCRSSQQPHPRHRDPAKAEAAFDRWLRDKNALARKAREKQKHESIKKLEKQSTFGYQRRMESANANGGAYDRWLSQKRAEEKALRKAQDEEHALAAQCAQRRAAKATAAYDAWMAAARTRRIAVDGAPAWVNPNPWIHPVPPPSGGHDEDTGEPLRGKKSKRSKTKSRGSRKGTAVPEPKLTFQSPPLLHRMHDLNIAQR
eukprot:m.681872 g.681872  ORF g.681872 m.681872 type:complete len:1006 (+) comp22815_c0_seq6:164-3181(+)